MTTGDAEPVILIRDLRRRYRQGETESRGPALDGVSMTVAPGTWLSLLGPNGSGKSTLLRILATLDRPDEGEVRLLGMDPSRQAGAVRRRLGVVFQHPGLDALLTIRENLLLEASLGGLPRRDAKARAEELAAALDLTDRLDQRVGTLSGGLARRADLARALMRSPDLLLLDEPTTGLDPEARRSFIELLMRRAAATGMTLVMTTHLVVEAEPADLVVMLGKGRIVATGSPSELCGRFGAHVLVGPSEAREAMAAEGLTLREGAETVIGSGDADAVSRAGRRLIESDIAFRHGRPTLDDVYLVQTGDRLVEAGS